MKLKCDCGNEMVFETINRDTGEENSFTDGEGQYSEADIDKFTFWSRHYNVGIICNKCYKKIWFYK